MMPVPQFWIVSFALLRPPRTELLHQFLICSQLVFSASSIAFQFGLIATANPAEPAKSRPRPNGIPAPLNSRIAPSTSSAELTNAVTAPIGPRISSCTVFQFAATAVARPIAPTIIIPIPSPMLAPENVKIAPITSSAPDISAVIAPMGPSNSDLIVSQFAAMVAAMPSAPTTIRPRPRPIFAPENSRITPISSSATLNSAVNTPSGPCSSALIVSQFAAITVANPIAPAIIKPKPTGILAPEKTSSAPMTSSAPDTSATTAPNEPCNSSLIASQFVVTAPQIANAPSAIKPMPSGILTPENVRIAPSAKSAAPANSETIALSWSLMLDAKLGAADPAPPELSPEILLISSNDARDLLAFLAAPPTPFNAFCSSYRFSAACALSSTVVPKIIDTS